MRIIGQEVQVRLLSLKTPLTGAIASALPCTSGWGLLMPKSGNKNGKRYRRGAKGKKRFFGIFPGHSRMAHGTNVQLLLAAQGS